MSYDRIAKYYDIAQGQSHQYQAEARQMDTVFREHGVQTVLDIACGTGSHLVHLAKLGYQCTGQDLSPAMLDVAREKARASRLEIEFGEGDMRSYHLNRTFDAVLGLYALGTVDGEDLNATLAAARQALRAGGVFVFNVNNAQAVQSPPPMLFMSVAAKQEGAKVVRFNNSIVKDDLWTLTSIYLVDDQGQTFLDIRDDRMRLYRMDDVKALLVDHGFRFESVAYKNVLGYKQWDMHICAIAVDNVMRERM